MRLKKLGAALVVVAALGAVLASNALAAAVTEDVVWATETSPGTFTVTTGSGPVIAHQVGSSTFATTVSGQAVVLHSTNIECVGCTIENSGGAAIGAGKLKFTGVTVEKPAGCGVASTIETKALKVRAGWMIGETNYVLFEPSAGAETGFATFELTGCSITTPITPKGTVFVESANHTGVFAVEQEVHSSATINSTAGGSLHVGTEAATLTGSAAFKLTGEHEGQKFATK